MVRASPPATQYLMGPLSWLAVEHSELRGPGRGESMRRRWCSALLAGDWRGGSRGKRPPRQCLALLSGRPRASCGSMGGPMSDGNGYGGRARQGQRRAVRPSLASPGGMGINASKIIIYRHYVLSTKGKMAPPARRAPENGPRRVRNRRLRGIMQVIATSYRSVRLLQISCAGFWAALREGETRNLDRGSDPGRGRLLCEGRRLLWTQASARAEPSRSAGVDWFARDGAEGRKACFSVRRCPSILPNPWSIW